MRFKVFITALVFLLILISAVPAYARRTSGKLPEISALPPFCETMGVYDTAKCMSDPRLIKHGCLRMLPPPQYWGCLKPHLAMLICAKKDSRSGMRRDGCKTEEGLTYLVLLQEKDKYEVEAIESEDEFMRFFSPIGDACEALSYASAVTGAYPVYDFPEKYFIRNLDEDGSYAVRYPQPTAVKEGDGGFTVNLFDHQRCGCFRPALVEISYFVSRDGSIKELSRRKVWEAHRRYNICID